MLEIDWGQSSIFINITQKPDILNQESYHSITFPCIHLLLPYITQFSASKDSKPSTVSKMDNTEYSED
jgi:hypothetical protein